ncbi:hypothetical protein JCM10449v2_006291 [Rhodotorula kratochvilovae]
MPPPADLLHAALNRHAAAHPRGPDGEPLSPQALERLRLSDEDEQIEVRTPIGSVAGSIASSPSSSRSTSPTRAVNRRKGGAGKPRRDKTKEREKAEAMKNPVDPFLRFPGQVLGRVLSYLEYPDLTRVGMVSKRWRRSQTLNYTWYLLLQNYTFIDPKDRTPTYAESTGLPTWRASEASEDWAARFASIFTRPEVEEGEESEHDENGLTLKEERELKWRDENEASELAGMDKNAMREFYKGLRNKKVKGKSFKGGLRTHEGDGLGPAAEI